MKKLMILMALVCVGFTATSAFSDVQTPLGSACVFGGPCSK